MSSPTWTPSALASEIAPLEVEAIRVVEGQHVVGTRVLVDTADEHELLEQLIEGAKPPLPREPVFRGLHYLLAASFRYPPLRHGSRFGTRAEPGIWYGSRTLRTAFAELAYYRFVFLKGTQAELAPLNVELTSFRITLRTKAGLDLGASAFAADRAWISSPTDYARAQVLGRAMREAGVQAFAFFSARDRRGGTNLAAFTPEAFAGKRPRRLETWHCVTEQSRVEMLRKDFFKSEAFAFGRGEFLVEGVLPAPAL